MNTTSLAQQILSSNNPEKEVNRLIATICQLHKENYNLKKQYNETAKRKRSITVIR